MEGGANSPPLLSAILGPQMAFFYMPYSILHDSTILYYTLIYHTGEIGKA